MQVPQKALRFEALLASLDELSADRKTQSALGKQNPIKRTKGVGGVGYRVAQREADWRGFKLICMLYNSDPIEMVGLPIGAFFVDCSQSARST